jgi:hypothetical protein
MDLDPDVVVFGDERFPRMEAHPNAKLSLRPLVREERALGLLSGRERLARIREGERRW